MIGEQDLVYVHGEAESLPDGWKVMQYSSVTLQNNNGTWQVASKTPVIREPISTRERWLR